jgi:hypothetical protein
VIEPTFGLHGASRPTDARETGSAEVEQQAEKTKRQQQSFLRQMQRRIMRYRAAKLARKMASRGLSKAFGNAGNKLKGAATKANIYGLAALVIARMTSGRSFENMEFVADPWNHMHRARAGKSLREQFMADPVIARSAGIRAERGERAGDIETIYNKLLDLEEKREAGKFQLLQDPEFQSNGPLDLFVLANQEVILSAYHEFGAAGVVDVIVQKIQAARGAAKGGF